MGMKEEVYYWCPDCESFTEEVIKSRRIIERYYKDSEKWVSCSDENSYEESFTCDVCGVDVDQTSPEAVRSMHPVETILDQLYFELFKTPHTHCPRSIYHGLKKSIAWLGVVARELDDNKISQEEAIDEIFDRLFGDCY